MSRVHDALRKAAKENPETPQQRSGPLITPVLTEDIPSNAVEISADSILDMERIMANVSECPYAPLAEALLVNHNKPREAPGEEFRTLRTRLNHLQTLQPLHTLVITSASPAEGKSFTATNLALTQAPAHRTKSDSGRFRFSPPDSG